MCLAAIVPGCIVFIIYRHCGISIDTSAFKTKTPRGLGWCGGFFKKQTAAPVFLGVVASVPWRFNAQPGKIFCFYYLLYFFAADDLI